MAHPSRPSNPRDDDRRARQRAQTEFDAPLILEAGAGTGKTAVLVARVVAWSLGPGWARAEQQLAGSSRVSADEVAARVLRRIVAITFTEAAAAEMASRVREALLALRRGELPPGVWEEALPPPLLVQARVEALLGALDLLGVRTIHGFCRRLLADHALDAGLHPAFEIDADGQHQAEVAREVLEAALPEAFGDPYDADFAVLTAREIGPRDVEQALIALLSEGAEAADLDAAALQPDAYAEAFRELRVAARAFAVLEDGRLASLAARSVGAVAHAVAETAAWLEGRDPTAPELLTPLQEELARLWPSKVRDRLGRMARGDFAKSGAAALGDGAEALVAAAARLHAVLGHVLQLDPELLAAARRVLQRLLAAARMRLRARGFESFGGLLRGARDLLNRRPELAAGLREEIDQLLIDEFQDTDALQCELLERLAFDGAAEQRPGLFLVGDPKQSIYGWRNADLRAYEAFVARACAMGGEVLPLVVNFRSTSEILAEVERISAPVMQEEPGLQPAFQPLLAREGVQASVLPAELAPVEHWVSFGLDANGDPDPRRPLREASELEAAAVAADLQYLQASGVDLGEVALLTRSSGDFDLYLGALRDAGIPFLVEREEQHTRRREVIDALAWIRCILDPNDALALVATARSSFVGVPDAAWLPLWRIRLPERVARNESSEEGGALATDIRRVAAELALAKDPVPGLERVAGWEENLLGFLASLVRLRELAEQGPVDRFVEALRLGCGLESSEAARHLGGHRLTSLDRVFRDLAAALEATGGSAAAVLSFLRRAGGPEREHREGRPRSFEPGAVHVLTIHKAKGLSFSHVYLLQTHKGSRRDPARRTALEARGPRHEYVLFGAATPGMLGAEQERQAVEERERVRLLYVATTRARHRLVIAGRRSAPPLEGRAALTHAELLAQRRDHPDDLQAWMSACIAEGGSRRTGADGVVWRFPALEPGPSRRAATLTPGSQPTAEQVVADEARLAVLREEAARRASRPWGGTASARHALASESGGVGEAGTEIDRETAMALGTAFHGVLETIRFETPPTEWRAPIEAALAEVVGDGPERARADALLERFFASDLPLRLHGLAPHVIAREVPLLVRPDSERDQAFGFVAGAIDLLYRDPEDGQLVVADYKTDLVAGPGALERRVEGYAGQGEVYVRAVQEALGLPEPPRFELWFLDAGRVTTAPTGAAGRAQSSLPDR